MFCDIMRGSRGDVTGGPTPPPPSRKITNLQGSLAILVRIPWKISKLPGQYSMLGHHDRPASETPFDGVLLEGR